MSSHLIGMRAYVLITDHKLNDVFGAKDKSSSHGLSGC